MSVLKYFKNTPRSPPHRATGLKCKFFFLQIRNEVPGKKGGLSPPQRASGPCRPRGGRQAPVARWGGRQAPPFFFSRDFVANLKKKKLHFGPVALWEGDRGIFLKYFKTDIYF